MYATFKSDLRFRENKKGKRSTREDIVAEFALRDSRKTGARIVSFTGTDSAWFVDLDPRRFELTKISWPNEVGGLLKKNDLLGYLESEITHLRDVPLPYNSLPLLLAGSLSMPRKTAGMMKNQSSVIYQWRACVREQSTMSLGLKRCTPYTIFQVATENELAVRS